MLNLELTKTLYLGDWYEKSHLNMNKYSCQNKFQTLMLNYMWLKVKIENQQVHKQNNHNGNNLVQETSRFNHILNFCFVFVENFD